MGALVAVVIVAIAGLFGRERRPSAAAPRSRPRSAFACGALLVVSFAAYTAVLAHAAATQLPFPSWLRGAPLVPLLDEAPYFGHTPPTVTLTMEALAVIATLALAGLISCWPDARWSPVAAAWTAAGAGAMLVCALGTRGLASSDLYAYVGYARSGASCYAHPAAYAATRFALIAHLWGNPQLPCAYGPLWVAVVHKAVVPFANLRETLETLRILAAAAFVACVLALWQLRMRPVAVAAFALNPAILAQYVVDGHNDLFGIACLLWARMCVRRSWAPAAIALCICAALVKLTLVLAIPLVFVAYARIRVRVICAGISLVAGAWASYALVGPNYVRAVTRTIEAFTATGDTSVAVLLRIAAVASVLAVAVAVLAGRARIASAFGFTATGSAIFPWYAIWGLPYAILCSDGEAATYLAMLPVLAFALSTVYGSTAAGIALNVALVVASATWSYAMIRMHDRRVRRAGAVALSRS